MANLLYLVHRMPYPPNKGDKVRSYHLLKHLAQRHQVFLGTFCDDPDDVQHIDSLRALCSDLHVARLSPRRARLASLVGLLSGQALTLRYYQDLGLQRWVANTVAAQAIDAVVVFSSAMGQYALRCPGLPMLVDLVDVDSAKWTEYAPAHAWPMSWLYRREGNRLLSYERSLVARATASFLVTSKEVELFNALAPELAGMVQVSSNGVDADYFSGDPGRASPYRDDEIALVFTGAMDYWPNVDAVSWFAAEALPLLRLKWPALRLHIVGRSPSAAVRALASGSVVVSGTVPDVRPYLQHAAVVVAPLRLARGLQNKVLEAMAMARPVVAAKSCVEAIDVRPGQDLLSAHTIDDYVSLVDGLLRDPDRAAALGQAGRQRVVDVYSWPAQLAALDQHLAKAPGRPPLEQHAAVAAETL
jgi:sugar transferase (PEP-CTERM/EpsH1 system associated)